MKHADRGESRAFGKRGLAGDNVKYKIAVCDDVEAERQYIAGMVKQWAEENGCPVSLREFSSAERFLFDYEEEQDYDVLLLDIEMGDMDGASSSEVGL